jgi:hypothetical protein
VKPVWALYASTLIAIWPRLISLNNSWNFNVLRKVIRKRRMFTVVVPSARDQQVVDICLTLITSKPKFTNPSEMSSVGVENRRCRIIAFMASGMWDRK